MRRITRSATAVAAIAVTAGSAAVVVVMSERASAAQFTGGNVVVYRVGSGGSALTNAATPVFLDEYAPGGGSPVQSIGLPTADSASTHALTAAGLSTSEGEITRSGDTHSLTVTGYDAAPGTKAPSNESLTATDPASTPRTVGVVGQGGVVDTTTAITGGPHIIRSAATADGSNLLVAGGDGGLLSVATGGSTATVAAGTATSNLNGVTVQGGKTFVSASFGNRLSVLDGTALTPLPGIPNTVLPYGYALLDLEPGVGYDGTALDTLYFVDSADQASTIKKYAYDAASSTWKQAGSSLALNGALGLVADADGTNGSLAVTTATGLYALTDTTGSSATAFTHAAPNQIATAPANTEFRGVALAPTPLQGPAISITLPPVGFTTTTKATAIPFAATVTDPDGVQSVTVALDGGTPVSATANGSTYSASVPASKLTVGTHTLSVLATDSSTSHYTNTASRTFTVKAYLPAGDLGPGTYGFTNKLVKHSGFSAKKVSGAPVGKGLTTKKKGTASFTFYGKSVTLHLVGSKSAGKITVTVAGKKHTVSLYKKKTVTITKTYKYSSVKARKVSISAKKTKEKKSKGYTVTLGWLVVK